MSLLSSRPIRHSYTHQGYIDYYKKVTFSFTASVRVTMRQQLINEII